MTLMSVEKTNAVEELMAILSQYVSAVNQVVIAATRRTCYHMHAMPPYVLSLLTLYNIYNSNSL